MSTQPFTAGKRQSGACATPMNSWHLSDSFCDADGQHRTGEDDLALMQRLAKAGPDHGKFLRMITVTADITAPLYWWQEFDTYKVGTVANSCSTMHKIHAKELAADDFSAEHLSPDAKNALKLVIDQLNFARIAYLETRDKAYWWDMIQLLPSSYNQRWIVAYWAVLALKNLIDWYGGTKSGKE